MLGSTLNLVRRNIRSILGLLMFSLNLVLLGVLFSTSQEDISRNSRIIHNLEIRLDNITGKIYNLEIRLDNITGKRLD